MKNPKRYTITAALPYANGPFHLGHICGAYLPSDIYARYLRSKGEDVLYVCGSDEHGAAITLRARKEGCSPQEIVDKYHGMLKSAAERFGLSFDVYDRTSAKHHHQTAQDFFKQLYENDSLTKEVSEQFYDEEHEQFLADRYIMGECPKCHYPDAYGDQCEKCGSSLSPSDLINPRSTLSGKPPVMKETWHYYLPMERHEEWLRAWITDGKLEGEQHHDPKAWKNHVRGQCLSWIDGGLRPRAMTRDLDWGVPVPLEGAEGKVLYVWLDAPIGYISATKKWAEERGEDWEKWWKDDESKLVHFIGKDNIVFHCIIFPILLKEHGEFILPDNVPANEFLNLEGDKLSTSRGWAVWLHEYLDEFEGQEDVMRYVLASILPETRDSEFTWKDFQARNNNELVAILGNFVNRALVLTQKYYDGVVPHRNDGKSSVAADAANHDRDLISILESIGDKIGQHIDSYRFRDALAEAMNLARSGNKYLADTEPWKLIKTDEERVKTIMNLALQVCANLTIVLDPFLPFTTEKLRGMLGIEKFEWDRAGDLDLIPQGHQIEKPSLLFTKVEGETIDREIKKLEDRRAEKEKELGSTENSKHRPMKSEVSFDDFTKMDIRVGEIKSAEKVEKADKLLKLTVDVGLDVRTVVSGIAEHFAPEEVVGKKVSVLLNLAPRKIRGVESQGMILMAENGEGKLEFVSPGVDMEVGAEVR